METVMSCHLESYEVDEFGLRPKLGCIGLYLDSLLAPPSSSLHTVPPHACREDRLVAEASQPNQALPRLRSCSYPRSTSARMPLRSKRPATTFCPKASEPCRYRQEHIPEAGSVVGAARRAAVE